MTVMEDVLVEEYMRALRIERLVKSEIEELPKGSIQKKKIKGKEQKLHHLHQGFLKEGYKVPVPVRRSH